ncbi:DNA ligase [Colwellia sp. 75C3]|nr:DNA ligase [Colwellia sp. 75C3]
MKKYYLLVLFVLAFTVHKSLTAQQTMQVIKPKIQHGVTYKKVPNINQYYVSEKLDGVRGYWDGEKLLTRQGNLINSPSWFTQYWPKLPIDGELWLDRGKFQALQSCVSKHSAEEDKTISCWKNVRFMMFDLPKNKGDFNKRVHKMQRLLKQVPSPYLAMISQVKLKEISELDNKLNEVIAGQGEGLMLHLASAHYKTGRNVALMKLKKHQDAEAIVVGHTKGKGKYQDLLGAIEVKTVDGIAFKIGSGFSDYQRANPPKIGTIITFKYNGLTDAGIPRFARFWRIKAID